MSIARSLGHLVVVLAMVPLFPVAAPAAEPRGVEELWRAYPIEQRAAPAPSSPPPERVEPASPSPEGSTSFPALPLIAGLALLGTGFTAAGVYAGRIGSAVLRLTPERMITGLALAFAFVAGLAVAWSATV